MQKRDRIRELVLNLIENANAPLETAQIVSKVQEKVPACTRTIVFKRLTDLRGDGKIRGKHIGSGKGAWIWWKKTSFTTTNKEKHKDKVSRQILQLLQTASEPLETAEIVDIVQKAIPTTRTIIFKRLTDLRGDGRLRGKQAGSGKGAWIWWRCNAFKE